jgi:hypothetical protein
MRPWGERFGDVIRRHTVARNVTVHHRGRLGNQLFEYCFGRILAERMDFALAAKPIPGFPGTQRPAARPPRAFVLRPRQQILTRHAVDVESVVADPAPREILLRGYFQRYAYYRDYKERIRGDWLRLSGEKFPFDPDDVVLHVRGGDLWKRPRAGERREQMPLPVSYYRKILDGTAWNALTIVAEDASDPVAKRLGAIYSCEVVSTSPEKDFRLLWSANRIVLSVSTFAWWAAWLSDAAEIHFPLYGSWRPAATGRDIDLVVDDEERYIYHDLGVVGDLAAGERDPARFLDA